MKLTPEEKAALIEEKHRELCKNLFTYWEHFSSILDIKSRPGHDEYLQKIKEYCDSFDKESKVFKAGHDVYEQAQLMYEKLKCAAVVEKFSSTHNWVPFQANNFKCKNCGYCASGRAWREYGADYSEQATIPHYDYESNSIHYTCAELQQRYAERKEKKYRRCKQCGVWGCPFWWEADGSRGNYKL